MASGVTTIFLSVHRDKLCDRLGLLLQEIQAGNNSDFINKEIVVIVDNLLDYKCVTQKQHNHISIKCNLIHK